MQIYLDQDANAAEKLWAKRKYAVLTKLASICQKIRNVLKNKEDTDFILFIELLEQAERAPEDKRAEVNAAQHIWGCFGNKLPIKRKRIFKRLSRNIKLEK